MDLSIIIPAFNEENRILVTVEKTVRFLRERPWRYELIVVDDGSSDHTAEKVQKAYVSCASVRCIRNPENRGKGYSVRQGVRVAQGGIVGYMDADYKTEISCLDRVVELLETGCDGVIGDRSAEASTIAVPRRGYRQIGSRVFRVLLHRLIGLDHLGDTQCGFKFFKRNIVQALFSRQRVDGYMFDVEILLLAKRCGYSIEAIPVLWQDDPDSRFNPVSGMARNLGELVRIYWGYRRAR
jgi:dolichyl-phosphate beta-glucosyltransferase